MMDEMVSRLESTKEVLRVSRFRMEYIADPPAASMECFIGNYRNYKQNKRQRGS